MGGILPALMQHHDIRYRQGVPGEVCRTVHVEAVVDAFKVVLRRQRRFIDQLVVFRLYGKAVAVDAVQRLKAIIQRFTAALELVDGEAAHRLVPHRPCLLHDSGGGLRIGGRQLITTGGDPQMILEDVSGRVVRTVSYNVEFDGDSREMCLYYTTKTGEPYSQDRRVFPKVLADGTYVYTLPRTRIVALRLDPCSPDENKTVGLTFTPQSITLNA